MTAERWLPVVGYEGWYDISSYGRVRRMKAYNNTFVGRILKEALDSRGYMFVLLSKKGVIGHFTIQWLVTEAFLGSRTDGKEVNHKDGNKTNNRIENLEYVTKSENALHAFALGLRKPPCGEAHGCAKLTEPDVLDIRRRVGKEPQTAIAVDYGISQTAVSNIATRKRWAWLAEA